MWAHPERHRGRGKHNKKNTMKQFDLFPETGKPENSIVCESVQYGLTKKKGFAYNGEPLNCSTKVEQFTRKFYKEDIEIYESSFLIMLSQSCSVLGWAKISQGGTSATVVDAKIVAKFAVDAMAACVILVHNHPSGNLNPSPEDISLTKRIREGLSLLDIHLLDHIILTSGGMFSMNDSGMMI